MTVNGKGPDRDGNVQVSPTGEDVRWQDIQSKPEEFPPEDHGHEVSEVEGLEDALQDRIKHSDFSDIEITGEPDLITLGEIVKTLIVKLKGTALAVTLLCCASVFGADLGPDTLFGHVPPRATIAEVAAASGVTNGLASTEYVDTATSSVLEVTGSAVTGLESRVYGRVPGVSIETNRLVVTNGEIVPVGDDETLPGLNLHDPESGETTSYSFGKIAFGTNAVSIPRKSGTLAVVSDVPVRLSQLLNDSGYVTESVTNGLASVEYVEAADAEISASKRGLTDLSVYRKAKDCWVWRNWDNPDADAPAPSEFLDYMSSPGSEPIRYEPVARAWYGAVVFWPDGRLKYGPGEIPPGGYPAGSSATNVNFAMYAYAPDGVTRLYRFGATASRLDPTNETLVCWSTDARNEYVRVATTDNVARWIDAGVASATNALRSVDGAARPLPKYLHALDFDDSYPAEAQEYYRSRGNGRTDGGCSATRSGGFLYRNFDYPFDDRAEFVVMMSAGKDRFASIGVAQVGTNLTESVVTSGKHSRWYKALPGATVDGINENGVVVEINVVDTEVSGWHTTGDLHPLAAVRWVLDNATNAQHGAEYLAANIRFPAGWVQNFHYMVADAKKTYIVENGEALDADDYYEPDEPAVMTNFRLSALPRSGMGLERFNLLTGGANITNAWYTNAYRRETNPPWVSDLADVITYTNDIFNAWAAHDKEYFRGRTNNGVPWWQSVHTSVYDIMNRTLRLAVQERDDWYMFSVPPVIRSVESDPHKLWNDTDTKYTTQCGILYEMVPSGVGGYIVLTAFHDDSDASSETVLSFQRQDACYSRYSWTNGNYKVTYNSASGLITVNYYVSTKTVTSVPGLDPTVPGTDIGLTESNSEHRVGRTTYTAVSHPQSGGLHPEAYDRFLRVSEYDPPAGITTGDVERIVAGYHDSSKVDGVSIAPEFQGVHLYSAGELISHDGRLYAAKRGFTSGQTFSASDWDETNLVSRITRPANPYSLTFQRNGQQVTYYDGSVARTVDLTETDLQELVSSKHPAIGDHSSASGNDYSVSLGVGTESTGQHSAAIGAGGVRARGANSLAIGNSVEANADNATAIGYSTFATAPASTALGGNAYANGQRSLAAGWGAIADGLNSTAVGNGSRVNAADTGGVALGSGATVDATNAAQIGYGFNSEAETLQFMSWKAALIRENRWPLSANVPQGMIHVRDFDSTEEPGGLSVYYSDPHMTYRTIYGFGRIVKDTSGGGVLYLPDGTGTLALTDAASFSAMLTSASGDGSDCECVKSNLCALVSECIEAEVNKAISQLFGDVYFTIEEDGSVRAYRRQSVDNE